MNDLEARTLETFKNVRNFGVTNASIFPDGTLSRDLFNVIGGLADDIDGHAAAQAMGGGAARQGTAGKAVLRDEILEDLSTLRRTARTMSGIITGIDEKF